jgi:hypothetical protein
MIETFSSGFVFGLGAGLGGTLVFFSLMLLDIIRQRGK